MADQNKRRHVRLKHSAKIRVLTPPGETVTVTMRDFSESGLYLECGDKNIVKIGDFVEVNTLEFEDAPVQKAKVVRINVGQGFAIEFIGT